PPLSNSLNQTMSLPSPASTIESLTREFQDSLELSQSKYAALDMSSLSQHESRSSERASTSSRSSTATSLRPHPTHSTLDIREAVKGEEGFRWWGANMRSRTTNHNTCSNRLVL
ncbi:jg16745, partial [Pararge aegeria aegeria]